MIYFGIDPGKSGAISAIWDDGEPYINYQKINDTEREIASYFQKFYLSGDVGLNACAVVEKVHSSPQMGVTSAFTFGQSYGFLRGLLIANRIKFLEVSPQKWQKAMGCLTKGNKNISKAAAQQRWPHLKITHANADSLLIAEYCRLYAWNGVLMTVRQSNSWTYNGKKAQAIQIRGDMALINIDGETERRWVKRSELVRIKRQWTIKEDSK